MTICCDVCGCADVTKLKYGFYRCNGCLNRVVYAPSKQDIVERAAVVRAGWTATEEQHRRLGHREVPFEIELAFQVSDHMVRRKATRGV